MIDIPLWTPESFKEREEECLGLLKDVRNWQKIPLLNHSRSNEFKDGSLVRFRGMIQDMLDNELYLEKYEIQSSEGCRVQDGRYYDYLPMRSDECVPLSSSWNIHGERRAMFVISVPGINNWVEEYERNISVSQQVNNEETQSARGQKRQIPDNEVEVVDGFTQVDNKRAKCGDQYHPKEKSNQFLSYEYMINSPLYDRPSKACMVKIYSEFENHKLNSVVDVVGFLSIDHVLDGSTQQLSDPESTMEFQAANPPPSLIPRIHVIAINQLKHINPLLDVSLMQNRNDPIDFAVIQKDLIIVLTQCLFGDSVAAEYLLSHLISTVYARTETQALGKYTLNISNIPKDVLPEYTSSLYKIIETLVPASYYFPMTLENMNTLQFTPKKDYSTNKLVSGLLQLAPHTHLILDETRLEIGKLETNGVLGIQSLSYLIKMQQFRCNFEFYELDFDTNIPVLILSEGKSMLPSDCHLPLEVDPDCVQLIAETMKAAKHYLQPKLTLFRQYLTSARIKDFNVTPSNSEMIQNDFVEMRRLNQSVGVDQLHGLLVLSRFLGIASGQDYLQQDIWSKAKNLEAMRKERIDKNQRK